MRIHACLHAHDSRVRKPHVRSVSRLFETLGDERRLRIVASLAHGELCVCHLEEALGLSQPNVSRHLGILRAAGLVQSIAKRDVLWRDVERLLEIRGPGACR